MAGVLSVGWAVKSDTHSVGVELYSVVEAALPALTMQAALLSGCRSQRHIPKRSCTSFLFLRLGLVSLTFALESKGLEESNWTVAVENMEAQEAL